MAEPFDVELQTLNIVAIQIAVTMVIGVCVEVYATQRSLPCFLTFNTCSALMQQGATKSITVLRY
jgi:predicted membrane-bound mannosyltransferase